MYNYHYLFLFSKFLTHFMLSHDCHFPKLINFILISLHKWWIDRTVCTIRG